jgi:hypothetical protein
MRSTKLLVQFGERFILGAFLSAVLLVYISARAMAAENKQSLVNCSDWAGKGAVCLRTACQDDFAEMLGVWEGRYRANSENLTESRPLESRQIFSRNGCYLNTSGAESYLVGQQTDLYPQHKYLPERRIDRLVVFVRPTRQSNQATALRYVDSLGMFSDYQLKAADSKSKMRVWTRGTDGADLVTLTERPGRHEKRAIQVEMTSKGPGGTDSVLLTGIKKSIAYGQTSFFKGKAWLIDSKGAPLNEESFVLKSDFDPVTGVLSETEINVTPGRGGQQTHTHYVVTKENPGATQSSSISLANFADGTRIELYNMRVASDSFDEQRFYGLDGKLLRSRVRSYALAKEADFSIHQLPSIKSTRP